MSMLIYTIMKKQFIFPVVAVLICGFQGTGQTLSNLRATCNDPLFTTYAAPPERSSYQNDQAYQFLWFDPQSGTEMISTDGPNAGMAFTINNRLIFKLQEFQREPVISVSYSDLIKFSYYPVKDLGVEVFAAVYSSQTLFMQYRLVNEGSFPLEITLLPYLYFPATDSINRISHTGEPNGYIFPLTKKKDGWMEQHDIPFIEHFNGYWGIDCGMDSTWSFCEKVSQVANPGVKGKEVKTILRDYLKTRKRSKAFNSGLVSMRTLRLNAGESTSFRISIILQPAEGVDIQSVPFFVPVGNILVDLRAHGFQHFHQEHRGSHPIDVVITVNDDPLPPADSLMDSVHPFAHPLHDERVGLGKVAQI